MLVKPGCRSGKVLAEATAGVIAGLDPAIHHL
jgi:hypothetical protein